MRGLAGEIMDGGFVTIDSGYVDESDEKEEQEGSEGTEYGEGEITGEGKESEGVQGQGDTIELPKSLRHGIFICPPAKLEDSLRR